MSVSVILCAAGKGTRTGFQKNKLLKPINGYPVLLKTVEKFQLAKIEEIVVAVSKEDKEEISSLLSSFEKVKLVEGGQTRFASVYNALQAVTGEIVLIHDGARPFVTKEIIEDCIQSVEKTGSGICAIPSTDTVAIVEDGIIVNVPDRKNVYRIQTPQGFYTIDIKNAYAQAHARDPLSKGFTDDSSVYATLFETVCVCEGSEKNIKLTFSEDFFPAERVGFGVDTHAFGKAQDYVTLCGVKIPSESGLIAHSDGDAAVHALMDAMLSGAGLKDIGYYFPDTDEKWRGADSMKMLLEVKKLILEQGFRVKNVSVAIQAEKPRLAKYIDDMKEHIATALDLSKTEVGITAGTNEKLGYVGEGKGITVYSTVLLY